MQTELTEKIKGNNMAQFQTGQVIVYGNLGVYEVEHIGPMSFGDGCYREYYTLRPYFSDSNDRTYIPTNKQGVLRPVVSPEQAEALMQKLRTEEIPAGAFTNQTFLAAHYQEMLQANEFYMTLKLFKEIWNKEQLQKSRGRKVNAMDTHFCQLAEHLLSEELAVAFQQTPAQALERLKAVVEEG